MYADCINTIVITMDCISANHVDTCNRDTIFCNTPDCAYKYAQVMSSLDFDNVKSNKSSQSCKYCLVWATKVALAAICLDISSASFGILFSYCQKYDIPVPL